MKNFKQQEKLSKALYLIASILLLTNIFLQVADKENKVIGIGGWVLFLIAAGYAAYLSKAKKKVEEAK